MSVSQRIRALFRRRLTDQEANGRRIRKLRALGVRIGEGCLIYTEQFSTEPYLVTIGDEVSIAAGTTFFTHNGFVCQIRDRYPDSQIFGRITVGSRTAIGVNCMILPGTTIGNGCIVQSGSVVRGSIPDRSLVYGNPARVAPKAELLERLMIRNPDRLETFHLAPEERERVIRRHFGIV